MTDVFSRSKRSTIMSSVRSEDTKPEKLVRSTLHRMGYRFRLHTRKLPGKPDIVLPKYRKVIFVHGCFWHGHRDCKRAARPQANAQFWDTKIDQNMKRDARVLRELRDDSWSSLVIWQCQIQDTEKLSRRLKRFLESSEEKYK